MSSSLRSEVLKTFKKLHKTRREIFQGDKHALEVLRHKINDEFKKNKNVSDPESIKELTNFANEVEKEVRTTVIQLYEKQPGLFEARIHPETQMFDNIPYGQKVDKSQFKNIKRCSDPPKKKT